MRCHAWDISPKKSNKVGIALSKNLGFQNVFAKTRGGSITRLPMQLTDKQMDPPNRSRKKWASDLRNAVGNGACRICFEKIQKFQLFLTQIAQKNMFGKNNLNMPLN